MSFTRSIKSTLSLSLGKRFLATEATAEKSEKLLLNFAAPHLTLFQKTAVERVDIPSTAGDMGILANHVPTIQQLRPGVVEVLTAEGKAQKYFVSGGFAVMNPDNSLNVNVLEAVTQDQVDKNAIRQAMAEAQKLVDSGSSDAEKALGAAQLEVYQALEKF